jgi:hypothetical protein
MKTVNLVLVLNILRLIMNKLLQIQLDSLWTRDLLRENVRPFHWPLYLSVGARSKKFCW